MGALQMDIPYSSMLYLQSEAKPTTPSTASVTNHFELRAVFDRSGLVLRPAAEHPCVPGTYGLYVKCAHLGTHLANRDSVVGRDSLSVHKPNDLDRQVSFRYDAVDRHRIQRIDRILTKVKGENHR